MRAITDHIVPGDSANHQLTIAVTDEPGQGGANHSYVIDGYDTESNPSAGEWPRAMASQVLFQNGPIKEFGVNGVTQEALAAIIIDRLRSFQAGPFACPENEIALNCFSTGLEVLQRRTKARIARGVEGTHHK